MKNYFTFLATIGLVFIFLVAWLILGQSLWQFLGFGVSQKSGIIPIIAGIIGIFICSLYLDKKKYFINSQVKSVFYGSLLIYFSGVLTGCLTNFFYFSNLIQPLFGYGQEFYSWFMAPFYWLTIIGGPLSLFIGMVYSFFCFKKD